VRSPSLHDLAPLLKKVSPLVGQLGVIPKGVGQTGFNDLTREVRLFGGPIAER
jgi:hypothetical protein